MFVECKNCSKKLSKEHAVVPRKPCPACGSTVRILELCRTYWPFTCAVA